HLFCVVVDQVKQSERNIFRMTVQRRGCNRARFFGGLRLDGSGAEIAKHDDATFANNLLADLMNRCDHEMSLFSEAVAIELELDVFHPRGWPTIKRGLDQRAQDVPNLGPAFSGWPPEKLRMLGAEDW